MPLAKQEKKLQDIATAALSAFTEKGYRLTQVADIAKSAKVAAGTIYLFAKSKEDLFWLALNQALGRPLVVGSIHRLGGAELRESFRPEMGEIRLRSILDSGAELPSLEAVLTDHWNVVSHAARAIKLIERCARDWPELGEVFYDDLRKNVVRDLSDYLSTAAQAGLCRQVPNPDLAARLIIETIAWFAMHRLGDHDAHSIPNEEARDATIDALLHAYEVR